MGFSCLDSGYQQLDNIAHVFRLGQEDPTFFYGGDSGSPVYYVDTSGSYLLGIFTVRKRISPTNPAGRVGYAVPAWQFYQAAPIDHYWDRTATTLTATLDFPIQAQPQGNGICTWAHVQNTGAVAAKEVQVEKLTNVSNTLNYWSPSG